MLGWLISFVPYSLIISYISPGHSMLILFDNSASNLLALVNIFADYISLHYNNEVAIASLNFDLIWLIAIWLLANIFAISLYFSRATDSPRSRRYFDFDRLLSYWYRSFRHFRRWYLTPRTRRLPSSARSLTRHCSQPGSRRSPAATAPHHVTRTLRRSANKNATPTQFPHRQAMSLSSFLII
jgi:hypothetical protein